jgi:hypothetical protein
MPASPRAWGGGQRVALIDGHGQLDRANCQEGPARATLPLLLHRPHEALGVLAVPSFLPNLIEPLATTTMLNGRG